MLIGVYLIASVIEALGQSVPYRSALRLRVRSFASYYGEAARGGELVRGEPFVVEVAVVGRGEGPSSAERDWPQRIILTVRAGAAGAPANGRDIRLECQGTVIRSKDISLFEERIEVGSSGYQDYRCRLDPAALATGLNTLGLDWAVERNRRLIPEPKRMIERTDGHTQQYVHQEVRVLEPVSEAEP